MEALSKIEQTIYGIVLAGPNDGMTSREIFEAQTATTYAMSAIQNHGIKILRARGMLTPIGSRARMNKAGTQRTRQTLWLDTARAGVSQQEQPPVERGPIQETTVHHVSGLIETRHALAKYLEEAITEDGGQADPSWLARLIVRDWDIKPRG